MMLGLLSGMIILFYGLGIRVKMRIGQYVYG